MLKDNLYPLVSIMIPTYNQEIYISDAIESALSQDYPNLEVIVSDDCSKDNTSMIVKKYISDSRFHYFKNDTNLGRVGNYHHTLYNLTKGEWIINLDGDDYYLDKTYISRAMRRIISHENIVCYFGKKYLSKKPAKYADKLIDDECYLFNGIKYFKNFFSYGQFAHCGTLYRKDIALLDSKCYTFRGIQSDFHGIIRFSLLGNVILAHEPIYMWRIHDRNATTSINNKAKYKSEILCQSCIIEDIGNTLSIHEKKMWLLDGKKWARKQYVVDCLNLKPCLKSILIGIRHFNFSKSYIIILIKCILATLGLNLR